MNHGTVFEAVSKGSQWGESVLYSFCRQTSCTGGNGPLTITLGAHATLFGTTVTGGNYPNGESVAFKLEPR